MALDLSALDDATFSDQTASAASPRAMRAPLERFEEDPENPRFEFDDDPDFPSFVEDIRVRGILQPLIVREVDGMLRIRFGARRLRAARQLGLVDVPYVITEDERQFDDYAQVSENQQRKNLQPLELATFISKKISAGEKKKDVAAKLQIDASAVTHLLSLVDAPDFLLNLYHSRKCRAAHYLYELRKLHGQEPALVERYCEEAAEVDRRLLATIASALNPQATASPSDFGVASEGSTASSTRASDGGDAAAGAEPAGPAVQQVPPHNPDIEPEPNGRPVDPSRIKKPLLLGKYRKRDVMIDLQKRPTAVGLVVIRYEDGSGEDEVVIGDVKLTQLTDAAAA